MPIQICEIKTRAALTRSRIPGMDYALNPYRGCGHACRYCYMQVMGRGRPAKKRPWGSWVEVKSDIARRLARELARKPRGLIMLSSATDPYQPIERERRLTRACLELIAEARFPVSILTKSALIQRDLDLLAELKEPEIGITITTDREEIRKIFEPRASPISERLQTLAELHKAGLEPFVFVGPILPQDPAALARALEPHAARVVLDRLNYPWLIRDLLWQSGVEGRTPGAPAESRAPNPSREENQKMTEAFEAFTRIMGEDRVDRVC